MATRDRRPPPNPTKKQMKAGLGSTSPSLSFSNFFDKVWSVPVMKSLLAQCQRRSQQLADALVVAKIVTSGLVDIFNKIYNPPNLAAVVHCIYWSGLMYNRPACLGDTDIGFIQNSTRSSPPWRLCRSTTAYIVLDLRPLIWGFGERCTIIHEI